MKLLLSLMIVSSISMGVYAEDGAHDNVPAGATPFEEVVDLDKSGAARVKKIGYKLPINGVATLVGPYKMEMMTGELMESGLYDATGKKTGAWKLYHKNGKVLRLTTWSKGITNGPFIQFDQEGIPQIILWASNGKPDGISVELSPEGKIMKAEKKKDGDVVGSLEP